MHILSAPPATFVKRVLPFIVLLGACAWHYWPKRNEGAEPLIVSLVVLVIGTLITLYVFRNGPWRMADTVEDRGDRLVITRWKSTIEVPLSQVQEIMQVRSRLTNEVIIILRTPCAFGSEIAFFPPDKRKAPQIEYALETLSRRVSSQGSKHVA
jgi:hypothetical protein